MRLNKAVVASVQEFLKDPQEKAAVRMIASGSIFRYLECQDQLGVEACDQLVVVLNQYIDKLSHQERFALYRVLSRRRTPLAWSPPTGRRQPASHRPSMRKTCY